MVGIDGGMGPDCLKIIGGMGTAIVGLCGALAYVAKGWLDSVLSRVADRDASIAQILAARTIAIKRKEVSP